MPAWPGSLPQAPLLGATEKFPDNLIRTKMDTGPDKVRRRFTAGVTEVAFPLLLTAEQADDLDTFFRATLKDGSLRFDFRHPRTGAQVEMRFLAPPELRLLTPSKYRATLRMEILP
jgi:hypothetical protein